MPNYVIDTESIQDFASVYEHNTGELVADFYGVGAADNARLFVAAQRMLEACRAVMDYHHGIGDYNFSLLPPGQRENAAFDAWQEVENIVTVAIAEASDD